MEISADAINKLIRNRRSVKPEKYSGIKADDAIIHQMLENARWAPTHALTQPWRFTVFAEDGLKKFADFQAALYKSATPEPEFKDAKYQGLLHKPLLASHVIMIGMSRQESGKIPEAEEICAVACAVENMLLTAAAYGIACYWSTGGMTYHPEMLSFLGLEKKDKCMGMLYIGNYSGEALQSPRLPVETYTQWVL